MDGTFVDNKMIMTGWVDGYILTSCDDETIRVQNGWNDDHYDLRKCEMPLWVRERYIPIERSKAPNSVKYEIQNDLRYKLDKEPWLPISYVKSIILSIKEWF
jgi:hypothetical protein